MSDRNPLAQILHDSNELWRLNDARNALKLLDESIAQAGRKCDDASLQTLARHAAIISESIGDLPLARRYNEQALAHGPDNPMALYGLAKILLMQGETDLAKQYARKCYQVSSREATDANRGILELLTKWWPEIGKTD